MPTTYAIPDGRVAMAATLFTGTSGNVIVSNAVNGVSFQPDFLWFKARSNAQGHSNVDSVRGANKLLQTNLTNAEATLTNPPTFNTDGFTSTTDIHTNAYTYVAWQWKAGGTAVSNTAGSITSSVSANPTAGFSVVTYTGNGAAGATCGHGLGVTPSMVIWKNRSGADAWITYHNALTTSEYLVLNTTAAKATYSGLFTGISSTLLPLNNASAAINASANNYVAYCFAPVAGYSAFGSYTGNGSADGPFVYLGFRPRWVLLKVSSTTGDWVIYDTSRNTYNVTDLYLYPNSSAAEGGSGTPRLDILSNGFKLRQSGQDNTSGATYIYMAFAENPFKYANAR